MKRFFLLLILLNITLITTYSLPAYIQKDNSIQFTTFVYPYVFELGTSEISAKRDPELYTDIVEKGNFDKSVFDFNFFKMYSDYFISSFSKVGFYYIENIDNFENSGFTEERLTNIKIKNLKGYIDSFKKGYTTAHRYFSNVKDVKKRLEFVYFIPFVVGGSPEASSVEQGNLTGLKFFKSHFERLNQYSEDSAELSEFIKDYAFSLGMIAYIKTYYVK